MGHKKFWIKDCRSELGEMILNLHTFDELQLATKNIQKVPKTFTNSKYVTEDGVTLQQNFVWRFLWISLQFKHALMLTHILKSWKKHWLLPLSAMLGNWFISQPQSFGIESNIWFQHDRVPAHFAITVREYFNEVFSVCWISRGSAILPAPLDWLPQSSDLSTCDNFLWGFI